ncbi:CASPA protein, partial [Upupa epops]|nr:CASPA protein [Upupa epops]
SSNMEHAVGLNFRQQLLFINENLVNEDVAALKFLCTDLLPFRKLESVKSALDIFQLLMDEDYLSEEDTFLLAELLYTIKCHFLLKKLGYTKRNVQECLHEKGRVSPYRRMMYELSENITIELLKEIVLLLQNYLPKRQITLLSLELLILLEKQNLVAESNVQILEEVLMKVSPDLVETINCYKRAKVSIDLHLPNVQIHIGLTKRLLVFCLFLFLALQPQQENTLPVEERSLSHIGNVSIPFPIDTLCTPQVHSYKMDGPHRGFCLVINNVKFGTSLPERKGSYKDAEELKRVFTWLGLDVRTYPDQTSQQIIDIMQAWQRSQEQKDRDCFICCILSHGESGAIYGKDEKLVSIRMIMSHFTAKQCPQLAEKPKLFFIQACQGKEIQCPVYVEADARNPDLSSMQHNVSLTESIPEEADFLLGMATIDGYVSFRHIQQGSWYIQALCSKLLLLVPRGEDILSILTQVNEDVSRRVDRFGTKKQMPQPAYTLRRRFIFPIPRDPPP